MCKEMSAKNGADSLPLTIDFILATNFISEKEQLRCSKMKNSSSVKESLKKSKNVLKQSRRTVKRKKTFTIYDSNSVSEHLKTTILKLFPNAKT